MTVLVRWQVTSAREAVSVLTRWSRRRRRIDARAEHARLLVWEAEGGSLAATVDGSGRPRFARLAVPV